MTKAPNLFIFGKKIWNETAHVMCSDFEIFWKSCSSSAFVSFDDMDLKIPPIERKWRVKSYRKIKFLKFSFSEILHREDYRETIANFFYLPRKSRIFEIWTSYFSSVFLCLLRSHRTRFEEVRVKNGDFSLKRNFWKIVKILKFSKKTFKCWGEFVSLRDIDSSIPPIERKG